MKIVISVIAVAVLAAIMLGMFCNVSEITTSGNVRYTSEEIVSASALTTGGSLFLFDSKSAEDKIVATFPYISAAKAERHLPNRINISVVERVPLARVELPNSQTAQLDADGVVICIGELTEGVMLYGITLDEVVPIAGEPLLQSEGDEQEKFRYALEILSELYSIGLFERVTHLDANMLSPEFGLGSQFTVRLGKREDTARKIDFLNRTLEQLTPADNGILDLSISGECHYIPD